MQHISLIIICLLILIINAGCSIQQFTQRINANPADEEISTPFRHPQTSPTSVVREAALSPLIAETTIPTATWSTYIPKPGVSIAYSSTWSVHTVATIPDTYYFDPPGVDFPAEHTTKRMTLNVYPFPEPSDPYSWMPNEGGYEVHWPTPVTIGGAEGLLFVWGSANFEGHDPGYGLWAGGGGASLMALFYNEEHQLEIWLTAAFDDESTRMAQAVGLAATVAERFPIFEHMLHSVRFHASGESASSTPTPLAP
jgi:hypothetical protein